MEIKRILENSALFTGLSDDCFEEILKITEIKSYKADEIIMNEGEDGDSIMFIAKGNVDIIQNFHNLRDRVRLATLEAGSFFGEMSLLDINKRSASAVAINEVSILSIKSEGICDLFSSDKGISYLPIIVNIARGISGKLRMANNLIAKIARLVNNYNYL